jgi:hypothetical protein
VQADGVRVLAGRPHRHLLGRRAPLGHRRARLYGGGNEALVDQFQLDDVLARFVLQSIRPRCLPLSVAASGCPPGIGCSFRVSRPPQYRPTWVKRSHHAVGHSLGFVVFLTQATTVTVK